MDWFRFFCFYSVLVSLVTGCAYKLQPLYVDLGNAGAVLPAPASNVHRIFIDRVGNLYPDTLLSRTSIREAGYHLNAAFTNDPLLQQQLLGHYNLSPKDTAWANLQRAIMNRITSQINRAAAGYSSITVLIHGIGNDINQDNRLNRNPYDAYQSAERRISSLLAEHGKKTFFIEVYWDALHRVKRTDFTAVFAGAGTNAYYAGLGLRRVVSGLETDSLVVLTHSLGAKVGCQLLFNLEPPPNREALRKDVSERYTDTVRYNTPPQRSIHLGMLAPAIPGVSTFNRFYNRTGHATPVGNEKDRYAVWVGVNNKDRIISKGIIAQFQSPLLVRYVGGSTALGALRTENKRVVRLFNRQYPQSAFTAIDFQDGGGNQSPQTAHYFSNYCNNQHFPELIKALYHL